MTQAPTGTSQPPARLEPAGPVRLTGRSANIAIFALSFLSLLMAARTGWNTLANAAFACGCGLITYYTRASGLRAVVVSPPLLFLAGCVCAQAATASGPFMAAERILVTLGTSATWLFVATALTVVVAVCRGFRPAVRRRPRRSAGRYPRDARTPR